MSLRVSFKKELKPIQRFSALIKIDQLTFCWEWQGCLNKKGYGNFHDKKTRLAHRWCFLYFNGKIPKNMTVNHICRNRMCVNPQHLELMTLEDNIKNGIHPSGKYHYQSKKTHCSVCNFPLSGTNLYQNNNRRHCNNCRQKRNRNDI